MRQQYIWACLVGLYASTAWSASPPIYRCTTDGVTTFSDYPCGTDAEPVRLDAQWISTYEPVPAAKIDPAKPRRRQAELSVKVDRTKERCAKLDTSLRDIDDKLRTGYTAKEGIRLEARKRSLRREFRELRC